MTRMVLATLFLVSACFITGCKQTVKDGARFQVEPTKIDASCFEGFNTPAAQEVDLVEDMASKRAEYFMALKRLEDYYCAVGNNTKRSWAAKEIKFLGSAPQYKYLMSAEIASFNIVAADTIQAADDLFCEAEKYNKEGRALGLPIDNPKLRAALSKYNELISRYPTSDKADDAAYRAGEIYQHFDDWEIAATYYQRTFQWNAETPFPARFKAAWIMDTKLKMKREALELYKLAYAYEKQYPGNMEIAENRIKALTSSCEKQNAKSEIQGQN